MLEHGSHVIDRIPVTHLNVLLLLGLALFGGTIGGRLFQKLRIPQVVGYIMIGVLIGQSGLGIVDESIIRALQPFNYFALALIGFLVGGELKKEVFSKYGKHFTYILLCEGIMPFLLVTVSIGVAGTLLFGPKPYVWALAFLLGAIASATDPATTTAVLKEYKTRGPLTTNILGIVALDDGLALLLFAIASSIAGLLNGNGRGGIAGDVAHALYHVSVAVGIGVCAGFILNKMLRRYSEKERLLALSVGAILLIAGISLAINVSMLLAVMALGVIVVNFVPQKSKEIFALVEGFTPPIYVLFFVLIGAKLKLSHMTLPIIILVAVYLIFGMTGKAVGSCIGARLSRAPRAVMKYLPFALFSQAGVAIGLSLLAAQHFPGSVGNTLIIIITATTLITQILGPPFTKFSVSKAGEVGLNITEEDIIKSTTAKDLMEKHPPLIYENMPLAQILKIFSEDDEIYYPVINQEKELKGIITVEGIKQTFLETDIGGLILADDLMQPLIATTSPGAPIAEVREVLDRYDIEYLPVVDAHNHIEGAIEKKSLNKFISTRIIELQKQVDSLG